MKILFQELKKCGWIIESDKPPFSAYRFLNLKDGEKLVLSAKNRSELYNYIKSSPANILLGFTKIQAEFVQEIKEKENKTFEFIGNLLGVSRQRAQQLYKLRLNAEKHTKWSLLAPVWKLEIEKENKSAYQIAIDYKVSPATVLSQMKKLGVDTSKKLKRKGESYEKNCNF